MKVIFFLLLFTVFFENIYAQDIVKLATKLNLYAGTKATVQWERVFSSQKRMQKYNIYELPKSTRDKLKNYLIMHAADSEQPVVPGL